MKTFSKYIIIVLNISLLPKTLHSQDSIQFRKLYLHTDRDIYFPGDSIWFKGYYLDANSHQFVSGIYSMYSDLIDDKGMKICSQIFPIVNGVAAGKFNISDSVKAGEYVVRAFTDLQKDLA
ncbi:MAG: MG2 domain-containing protein [Bacteroidales bacterium]|nr:MG2 domain-containing protein [Bacteroidales bacterium]